MKLIPIGQLRHRITIKARTETPSGTYQTTEAFSTVATVWGKVEPLKGLQRIDTKQVGVGVTHRIYLRCLENLTDRHWLEYDGRRFNIRDYQVLDERKRFLELMAEEVEKL